MSPDEQLAAVLTIETILTDAGREVIGNPELLALSGKFLAFASARVFIAENAITVESFDSAGNQLLTYELEGAIGSWRRGRLYDHQAAMFQPLHVPSHKVAPSSWLLPQEDEREIRIYLENGLLLRAKEPFDFQLTLPEVRTFWSDLFWLQSEDDEVYWEQLARFGLPHRVILESGSTGATFVELNINSAERAVRNPLETDRYHPADFQPMSGSIGNDLPMPGIETYGLGAGAGEHVGWLIDPEIIKEVQQLANTIAGVCGEFNKTDSNGGLLIDWYDRAASQLGTGSINAFTRIRELLKSVIALQMLPGSVNKGEIPPEMSGEFGQWLKSIFANKKIASNQRWCAFLNALKQPPPEFGGPQPTASDDKKYRQKVLLQLVDAILQGRYTSPVIPRPQPYQYSCWAFDLDARNFKMKLKPGNNVLKEFTVTSKGLRLDIAIEHVTVDFEYETQPAGSAGNVALCIFTAGVANAVEIQFGDGTITAKDVLLSMELIPTQKGKQIVLEVKLGDKSHADLSYYFQGSNIFTPGMTEVISMVLTLANSFESTLLDTISTQVKDFVADLDIGFPNLFHFEDAPAPVLDTAVILPNPGKAQLIGARLKLPADRAPVPLPSLTLPECDGDFAITLANDYLNGVLAYRLSQFKKSVTALHFDWRKHLQGASLPDVALPSGYVPPEEGGKYPTDYEETKEEWTIGAPVFQPDTLSTFPALTQQIGTITIPITYRLTQTHYAWGGTVHAPDVAPEWWWMGLKGPLGPGPLVPEGLIIDLDHIMTARFGMYRQADGQIISEAPPGLTDGRAPRINPSPGAHAVDAGGVIVDWFPYAVATEEHINVQLKATVPAHLNLNQSLSFLPALDLTYDTLQVSMSQSSYSASFTSLQNKPELFTTLVKTYLQPFIDLHPFQQTFKHPYMNVWPVCNDVYVPFMPSEKAILLVFTVDTMIDTADSQKLCIEKKGNLLKVTFRFLEQLAG